MAFVNDVTNGLKAAFSIRNFVMVAAAVAALAFVSRWYASTDFPGSGRVRSFFGMA